MVVGVWCGVACKDNSKVVRCWNDRDVSKVVRGGDDNLVVDRIKGD